MEYMLKTYTEEKYKEDLLNELKTIGLRKAVEKRCDLIHEECVYAQMRYVPHSYIQELMCEIMDLIEVKYAESST